ncbi:MAG: hypothetical protein HYY16_08160 [Planctomycetes bacterium]|nr:hypothetical protein [Planctomycetota bacterium]
MPYCGFVLGFILTTCASAVQEPRDSSWVVLEPTTFSSTGGISLTKLDDDSLLVSAPTQLPDRATYTVIAHTDLKGITGFRLDVLPEQSLPASGPGGGPGGGFVLSEFRIQSSPKREAESGTPVALRRPCADFSACGWPAASMLDGKDETGWATMPRSGQPQAAVFETRKPLGSERGLTLIFTLRHHSPQPRHIIGRFRLSATDRSAPSDEILSPRQREIDGAIRRAVTFLKSAGMPADREELILWTFMHAGVPESDPVFQELFRKILDSPPERTYNVALRAMIFEQLDRVQYQGRIWQCAQFLVDNQCANGQWSYGESTDAARTVPALDARRPVATPGGSVKVRIARKRPVARTRAGPPEGDNSNSQYAALGLRACADAGIVVPQETLARAAQGWTESAFAKEKSSTGEAKGWNYKDRRRDPQDPYPAMTAGGVGSLIIYEHLRGRDWKKNPVLRAGLNWLGTHVVWDPPDYYAFYALERVGVLTGVDTIGKHEWYSEGARFLLEQQLPDGSWQPRPDWKVADTCFAILFLRRATRTLLDVPTMDGK